LARVLRVNRSITWFLIDSQPPTAITLTEAFPNVCVGICNPPSFEADGAQAPPASDLLESVDPVSLQASQERVDLAFRQPVFGDARNLLQHLGFRYSLGLNRFEDQPPESDVHLHHAADEKAGAL
jgi:hypothetical protein